ncbi:hypothetical protein [Acidovorax sp.]|jgi:hypothetical protein|uniref:hypothetical protein n=1 Tax=Acidovorax sp. TaxID=1872122 RepID=UPI00391F8483
MLKSKFMRWICLLPAAFAAAFVAQRLTKFVSAWQMGHGVLGTLLIELGSGAVLGAVFVLAGVAMAPSHRRQVAMALFTMVAIVFGITVFTALLFEGEMWVYANGTAMLVGALVVAYPRISATGPARRA